VLLPLLLHLAAAPQDTSRIALADVIAAAIRTYPTVAAAEAQRASAEAAVGGARAALLPHASLSASLTRYQEPMIVYPLHSLNLTEPPPFDRTLVQPGVTVGYTLFDFGLRNAQIAAAEAQRNAADASAGASIQAVVSRAVAAYVQVLATRDRLAAADQDVAALRSEADRAQQLLAVGKAARVDGLRTQAALQRAIADRVTGASELELAEHRLASVTGMSFAAIHAAHIAALQLGAGVLPIDTTGSARAALVSRVMDQNPDAVIAGRRATAATAAAAVARAMSRPTLQATGAWLDPGSINGNFHPDWQVGIGLSYALFTGGATGAAVRAADAEAAAARAAVRLAQLNAEDAIDQSLAAVRQAQARTSALESAEAQGAEVVRIEALSRTVGEGTETDYLQAAADLLATRMTLIDARYSELLARIELARLTGELSPDWVARNVESLP
jgi:outer membrane protein TolC